MGQKVNPIGFRLGGVYTWSSRWFGSRAQYRQSLKEDIRIRKFLARKLKDASVAKVEIERSAGQLNVHLNTAKPGMVIGRGGQGVETLQKELKALLDDPKTMLNLNIVEISQPNLSAALTVQAIIADIEKRIPFRRAMRQSMNRLVKSGVAGAKVQIGGRLDGADIARVEKMTHGTIPLHTMKAEVDYSRGMARTTYGAVGIKVWVYRGEGNEALQAAPSGKPHRGGRGRRS